jgi:hypothetical protein
LCFWYSAFNKSKNFETTGLLKAFARATDVASGHAGIIQYVSFGNQITSLDQQFPFQAKMGD